MESKTGECQKIVPKECLLWGAPCCPFPTISLFWKIAIGAMAGLMVVFAVTLWLTARSLDKVALQQESVMAKIDGHKQLTLENRMITSEIKGMLSGWISERRQGIAETRIELKQDQDQERREHKGTNK